MTEPRYSVIGRFDTTHTVYDVYDGGVHGRRVNPESLPIKEAVVLCERLNREAEREGQ